MRFIRRRFRILRGILVIVVHRVLQLFEFRLFDERFGGRFHTDPANRPPSASRFFVLGFG